MGIISAINSLKHEFQVNNKMKFNFCLRGNTLHPSYKNNSVINVQWNDPSLLHVSYETN